MILFSYMWWDCISVVLFVRKNKCLIEKGWTNWNSVCDSVLPQNFTDINVEDDNQQTPLFLAASEGHWSVVECLVGWGSVLNAANVNGDTPLHSVVSSAKSSPVESTHLKEVYMNACVS